MTRKKPTKPKPWEGWPKEVYLHDWGNDFGGGLALHDGCESCRTYIAASQVAPPKAKRKR